MSTPLLDNPPITTGNTIRNWIAAAAKAPSPDNNQPWAFRPVDEAGAVEIHHDRGKALPSDVNDLFSWIGIGAAVENLVLKASVDGWVANVEYHSRPFRIVAGIEHVATVTFAPGGHADPLADWIDQRVTNRKLYRREPVPAEQLQALNDVLRNEADRVVWLTGRPKLKKLASLVRVADRIRFEHQPFHDEFHKVLRYGEEHARSTGDGLELKTLEVPAIAGPVFRWLRPWKRMRFANRLGMSRMFAANSVKQVLRSGAVGLLATTDCSDHGYLEAGRSFQRLWLAATQAGLAFQPMGGLPLFLTKLDVQGSNAFLPQHAKKIQSVATAFRKLFSEIEDDAPVMLFRIGHAPAPSARSVRYSLDEIVLPRIGDT